MEMVHEWTCKYNHSFSLRKSAAGVLYILQDDVPGYGDIPTRDPVLEELNRLVEENKRLKGIGAVKLESDQEKALLQLGLNSEWGFPVAMKNGLIDKMHESLSIQERLVDDVIERGMILKEIDPENAVVEVTCGEKTLLTVDFGCDPPKFTHPKGAET